MNSGDVTLIINLRGRLILIEFIKLTKRFGDIVALNDISFSVDSKEIIGVIGHNGAGKTSLFMIANGLSMPTIGDVQVNNFSLKKNIAKIRALTSLYTDKMHLYPQLTVKQIIKYFSDIYKSTNIDWLIDIMNINKYWNCRISALSTGNLKKVQLIISLLNKPQYLFLDEPFSGLDPDSKREFTNILQYITRENVQLFISSHQLLELELLINRLIILKDGILIEDSSLSKLMKHYFPTRFMNIEISLNNKQAINGLFKKATNYNLDLSNIKENATNCVIELEQRKAIDLLSNPDIASLVLSISEKKPNLDDLYCLLMSK
jgi:ABC-2 type transport system ATP-binding protein